MQIYITFGSGCVLGGPRTAGMHLESKCNKRWIISLALQIWHGSHLPAYGLIVGLAVNKYNVLHPPQIIIICNAYWR